MPNASEIISFVSAVAAAFSAIAAWRVSGKMTKTDLERRLREVSLLANKIDAAATDVYELYEELKVNGDAMFSGSGGLRSGQHELFKSGIKEKQEAVESVQEATLCLRKDNLTALSDDQITECLLKLDGHLVHVERIRRTFDAELASVKAEISFHLQLTEMRRLSASAERSASEMMRSNIRTEMKR